MSIDTVVLLIAIAATVLGVGLFFHYFLWVASWPRAAGRVVGNEPKKSNHHLPDEYAYFPQIAFTAADGQDYQVTGDVGLQKEWPVGRAVRVRYRAANPNHASIAKDWQRLLVAAWFLGGAAITWYVVLT